MSLKECFRVQEDRRRIARSSLLDPEILLQGHGNPPAGAASLRKSTLDAGKAGALAKVRSVRVLLVARSLPASSMTYR